MIITNILMVIKLLNVLLIIFLVLIYNKFNNLSSIEGNLTNQNNSLFVNLNYYVLTLEDVFTKKKYLLQNVSWS